MTTLPIPDLPARLTLWAKGVHSSEAAVGLLITHETWLRRPDFLDACIQCFDAYDHDEGDLLPVARIAFDEIPNFLNHTACSGSEARILLLAAELAGTDTGQPLDELLSSLDVLNVGLVLDAIAHHAGWHEHLHDQVVTGVFDHEVRP